MPSLAAAGEQHDWAETRGKTGELLSSLSPKRSRIQRGKRLSMPDRPLVRGKDPSRGRAGGQRAGDAFDTSWS